MKWAIPSLVLVGLSVLVFTNEVNSEPPVRNTQQGGGWGQSQQTANSGGYSSGGSGGYSNSGSGGGYNQQQQDGKNGGGWGQQQQQQQQDGRNGGGWGQQQNLQSSGGGGNNGGWGQQAQLQQQQQSGGNNGWSMDQSQMQKDQGNNGWGPQLNFEIDTANLGSGFSPSKIFRAIIGVPKKVINFLRESGLYILFIPLLIILPLLLLAFNFGKLIGGSGWGWSRSLSTVESGIIGYFKSPAWQKVAETLMDEHVFERVMKSLEAFKTDW